MTKGSFFFPAVHTHESDGTIKATAAIRLASLQSVRLKETSENNQYKPTSSFHLHHSILQAVSRWPGNLSLALNILTDPDTEYPLAGKVQVAILLDATGRTKQSVISDLLSRHASLFSLLSSYLNKAEFEIITDESELKRWIKPFEPKHVFAIDRQKHTFHLTGNNEGKEQDRGIGFLLSANKQPGTSLGPSVEYLFPWQHNGENDFSEIVESLLFHPSPLWIQMRLRPTSIPQKELTELKHSLALCEDILCGLHSTQQSILSIQTETLRSAISEKIWQQYTPVYSGGCFFCSESHLDEALVGAVAEAISPAPRNMDNYTDTNMPLKGGNAIFPLSPSDFLDPDFTSPNGFLSAEEAACGFRIPIPENQDPPGLPIKLFRTGIANPEILRNSDNGMLLLGYNRHRGHISPVMVSDDDRMRHTCVMGQTGTGKSVFLESMILSDINKGKGLCFIDPHGDSVRKILRFFPKERADDLILIDFLNRERIVPFNLLAWRGQEERDKIIDDLYGWVHLAYDMSRTGGPMFEQYFRAFLRLLMGEKPRTDFTPTILDFARLFISPRFRNYCLDTNQDSQVKMMIRQAKEAGGEASLNNMAPYITSKLNRFELDQTLRVMTGQPEMGIDFQDAMNSGKVVMVILGKGRFGEAASSLMASQIIGRFHNAAMRRIDMKPEKRRDFYLYVDEFQTVASKPFISMLAEARKFRLGLVLANQYADQLGKVDDESGDSVLKAVLGNVGNTTCFRLGVKDAKTMTDVFHPDFSSEDLINLPIGNCYVNLKTNSSNPSSFSMETIYSGEDGNEVLANGLYELSMLKYARDYDIALNEVIDRSRQLENLLRN